MDKMFWFYMLILILRPRFEPAEYISYIRLIS